MATAGATMGKCGINHTKFEAYSELRKHYPKVPNHVLEDFLFFDGVPLLAGTTRGSNVGGAGNCAGDNTTDGARNGIDDDGAVSGRKRKHHDRGGGEESGDGAGSGGGTSGGDNGTNGGHHDRGNQGHPSGSTARLEIQ